MIKFAEENDLEIFLLDLKEHFKKSFEEKYDDHYLIIESLDSAGLDNIVSRFSEKKIKFDYLILNYYFDKLREQKEEFSSAAWDELLGNWTLNTYLLLKKFYPLLKKEDKSRVVYFNSARGYTGNNCSTAGGDLIEAGLSGAMTGVMTSIAREIIPEGVSVNSIALADDYQEKWSNIKWVLKLWLTGMAEYSCAETIQIN